MGVKTFLMDLFEDKAFQIHVLSKLKFKLKLISFEVVRTKKDHLNCIHDLDGFKTTTITRFYREFIDLH